MNMNVTDLREKFRRSPINPQSAGNNPDERRKTSDRRVLPAEPSKADENEQRVWLTPGERTLIEDLYLLDDE